MGLGNGADSLPVQLATRHSLPKVFSLCYGSFDGGGAISFGRLPAASPGSNNPTLQYTPLQSNRAHPTYYVVSTDKWEVGGAVVATSGDFNVGYGTVMDSGTTFTYVPTKVFNAFAAELARQVEGKVMGPFIPLFALFNPPFILLLCLLFIPVQPLVAGYQLVGKSQAGHQPPLLQPVDGAE